jgi:YHS domain-containing protein
MVFYSEKENSTMKDPVCGMEVDKGEPLVHEGKEYRFCCATCRWAFEQNPDQFIES